MPEFNVYDLLEDDEVEKLGKEKSNSPLEEPKGVKSEVRAFEEPEILTITNYSYNMAEKLHAEANLEESSLDEIIDTAINQFHETIAQRPGENPVFITAHVAKLFDELPKPAYVRMPDGVYPVTIRDYDDLMDTVRSESFQEFFPEESDLERYENTIFEEFRYDHSVAPVLVGEEGLPKRVPTAIVYSPDDQITADPETAMQFYDGQQLIN